MSPCPICDCGKRMFFRRKDDRDLVICEECRHVTWAELPTEQQLADYYADQYTEKHGQFDVQAENLSYYADHAKELAGLVKKNVADIAIADIGCSYPTFLQQVVGQGARRVFGVDWSQEARAYGRKVGVPVITPDEFEGVPDESLDVLRYSHTLEHLPDPRQVVLCQIRKLKHRGLLYITQPNFPVFKLTQSPVDLKDSVWPTHLHYFNPLSLQILLDRVGVKLIRIFTTTAENEAEQIYRPIIDLGYATARLKHMAGLDERARGPLTAYPFFAGENVGIYAIRNGPSQKPRNTPPKDRNQIELIFGLLKRFRL